MTNSIFTFAFILSFAISETTMAQKTITFPSIDGLTITADEYVVDKSKPFILLCHQARYSRGEYIETAKKLNGIGFNCLAIDLRSGGEVKGVKNETYQRAMEKKLPVNYLDAEQDMIASVNYIGKNYGRKVILFGSSYSASLALKVGKENDKVIAVVAFSPGEYFGSDLQLKQAIKGLPKPVFAASSKSEVSSVTDLLQLVGPARLTQYIPSIESIHGSRALWEENSDHENCWNALLKFLDELR